MRCRSMPDGTVHDPVGGYADILARRIRFIGEAETRIAEDRLRILRFLRFNAEYGDGDGRRDGAVGGDSRPRRLARRCRPSASATRCAG